MKLTQETQQKQTQMLSQQMIQTLSVLQMSSPELAAYVEEKALENPLIEFERRDGSVYFSGSSGKPQNGSGGSWEEAGNRGGSWEKAGNRGGFGEGGAEPSDSSDPYEDLSLFLRLQLPMAEYSRQEQQALMYLIDSLDERGYLDSPVVDAAEVFGISRGVVERLVEDLRTLDPPGIAAGSLEECLLLQLYRLEERCPAAEEIIAAGFLEKLAGRRLKQISGALKIPLPKVTEALEVIRTLDPRPGAAFAHERGNYYIRPDVLVEVVDGNPEVHVNERKEFSFGISDYYKNLLRTTEDQETAEYLRRKLADAEAVAMDLQNRESTLKRVAQAAVDRQRSWFTEKGSHLLPLTIQEVAELLGVHPSTVSRAVRGKYLQCVRGTLALRGLFPGGTVLDSFSGDEVAPDAAREAIRALIAEENTERPYSDGALQSLLEKKDIRIARRTVAKYRAELGIPDRTGRQKATVKP